MTFAKRRNTTLSRRAAIASASTAFVSAFVCPAAARLERVVAHPLKGSHARVVAIGASDAPAPKFPDVSKVLIWAVSQVGSADLIALECDDTDVNEREVGFLRTWARHYACYVTLIGKQTVVVGPEGRVVMHVQERGVVTFASEIGVIAVSSENDDGRLPAAEIVILKGGYRDRGMSALDARTAASVGAYVLDLSGGQYRSHRGPVIYGPDGEVMTQAAPGWGQSVTASLNIEALRRAKGSKAMVSV